MLVCWAKQQPRITLIQKGVKVIY